MKRAKRKTVKTQSRVIMSADGLSYEAIHGTCRTIYIPGDGPSGVLSEAKVRALTWECPLYGADGREIDLPERETWFSFMPKREPEPDQQKKTPPIPQNEVSNTAARSTEAAKKPPATLQPRRLDIDYETKLEIMAAKVVERSPFDSELAVKDLMAAVRDFVAAQLAAM